MSQDNQIIKISMSLIINGSRTRLMLDSITGSEYVPILPIDEGSSDAKASPHFDHWREAIDPFHGSHSSRPGGREENVIPPQIDSPNLIWLSARAKEVSLEKAAREICDDLEIHPKQEQLKGIDQKYPGCDNLNVIASWLDSNYTEFWHGFADEHKPSFEYYLEDGFKLFQLETWAGKHLKSGNTF